MVRCLREFGFCIPIVIRSDGTIVDGPLRFKAAKKMGLSEIPVVIADDFTEAQLKAFRLVANQSANWAEWDDERLKAELDELENLDFDIGLTGFDLNEIEKFLKKFDKKTKAPLVPFDEEEDLKEFQFVVSKPGDVWLLGGPYLICGEGSSHEDEDRARIEPFVRWGRQEVHQKATLEETGQSFYEVKKERRAEA